MFQPRRLALGTVQFGVSYGVGNVNGRVPYDEVVRILRFASDSGLDTLDTAIAYGESEETLGAVGVDGWRVISKIPAVPDGSTDIPRWVRGAVEGSLERLRTPRLYGLLLHHPYQLLDSDFAGLYDELVALKTDGLVEKIGVSVYSPGDLDALWPDHDFHLVQGPFNVLDRRIQESGWLDRLECEGVEFHARSVFLQGLLLMDAASRPSYFGRWRELWTEWNAWLRGHELTPLQACLGFVASNDQVGRVIVGVDSLTQLEEVIAASGGASCAPPASLMSDDVELINPSLWKYE